MQNIQIWHNPKCSKSRAAKELLENKKIEKRNLQEEERENIFINKIYKQNCGDFLKILNKDKNNYYLCEFEIYPFKIKARKDHILKGNVCNFNFPWHSKNNLEEYIKINFSNKPTISEIVDKLNKNDLFNLTYTTIQSKILEYNLKEKIKRNRFY